VIHVINFIYLMSLIVWLGSMIFFSFIAAPSIFKTLPRETAGDVVGDVFPKYWMTGYICGALSIASYAYVSGAERSVDMLIIVLLSVMLVLMLFSGLVVGNNARIIKRKMRDTPDTELRERLRRDFIKVHTASTLLNLVIMVLGVVVVMCTAVGRARF